MSRINPVNIVASVEAKLKNIALARKIDYRFILIRYATERFLYRLSVSKYADNFILKGGNLFVIWQNGEDYRPTIDSDMLCIGDATKEHLFQVFRELCEIPDITNDGIIFNTDTIEIDTIREDTQYGGTRIKFIANLGRARINLQFDIGVGDAITPAPETTEYPVLLNGEIPKIKIYPMPTAIAEKFEVMISRGILNSRLKDYYDIWKLISEFEHDFQIQQKAIEATFRRREVPLPQEIPIALTEEFSNDKSKQIQWRAFLKKNKMLKVPVELDQIVKLISEFVTPILQTPQPPPTKWQNKRWR